MRRLVLMTVMAAVLAACANSEHGWSGANAEPFDGAARACHEQTRHNHDHTAFDACMESKGWHRTR